MRKNLLRVLVLTLLTISTLAGTALAGNEGYILTSTSIKEKR